MFILACFLKFAMTLEILVHWITLLIAFFHYLGNTLSQIFIMHRLVLFLFSPLYFTANTFYFPCLFIGRSELITALSHHSEKQSTRLNAEVRCVCYQYISTNDCIPVCEFNFLISCLLVKVQTSLSSQVEHLKFKLGS